MLRNHNINSSIILKKHDVFKVSSRASSNLENLPLDLSHPLLNVTFLMPLEATPSLSTLCELTERWGRALGIVPYKGRIRKSNGAPSATLPFFKMRAQLTTEGQDNSAGFWWGGCVRQPGFQIETHEFNVHVFSLLGRKFLNLIVDWQNLSLEASDILSWIRECHRASPYEFGFATTAATHSDSMHAVFSILQNVVLEDCPMTQQPHLSKSQGNYICACEHYALLPVNLVSQTILMQLIRELTLAEWIQASSDRGKLECIAPGLWAWLIDEQAMVNLRTLTRDEKLCILHLYRKACKTIPDDARAA